MQESCLVEKVRDLVAIVTQFEAAAEVQRTAVTIGYGDGAGFMLGASIE
jgi:hypothetical protein